MYGNQPAVDHFSIEEALTKIKNTATQGQNIIDSVRNAVTNPRAYSNQPAPSAAIPAYAPQQTGISFNPLWIVGAVVAIGVIIFIVKK